MGAPPPPGTANASPRVRHSWHGQAESTPRQLRDRTDRRRSVLHVGLVDECPVIVHGLQTMLAPYAPRLRFDAGQTGLGRTEPVDITLFDPAPRGMAAPTSLGALLADPVYGRVVAYSFAPPPKLVAEWLTMGCAGFLDKSSPAVELVQTITALAARESAAEPAAPREGYLSPPQPWPGQEHGLSRRESEVITLIVQGLTNNDISERTYLSINTVKTYIRSAYHKLEITRRSEAVRWGVQHGMLDLGARKAPQARHRGALRLGPHDRASGRAPLREA